MEEPHTKSFKLLIVSLLLIILLLLLAIFYIFYLISLLLTIPITVLIFLLCLFGIARLIIRLSVFPGSFWLWKRSIESHFCKEMSLQLLQKVQDLRISLEILLDRCSECEKLEFIERSIEASTYAKRMILTIIDTYTIEKERNTLTPYGSSLLGLLIEFQESLVSCKIHPGSDQGANCVRSLWEFIDEAKDQKDWVGIVAEEYPTNKAAESAFEICLKLESRLIESCGPVGLYAKIHRFLFDGTLGTYDQMRIELESRYDCEQIWVKNGGVEIDCMLVTNPEVTYPPTIIFCNPNAGLYEFAYYQSEWLDLYISNGINVMLWNYRGYGRSKGQPSPSVLKADGKCIVDYLRTNKKVGILGIHGESLGGIVACHLARHCEIDFLFVDRGFSRLNEIVQFSFGTWAKYLLKLISKWDVDASVDYLYVNCYKIISADSQDSTVNDLISMKSGVAIKLIETRGLEIAEGIKPAELDIKKYYHILNQDFSEQMKQALISLMNYVLLYIKNDLDRGAELADVTNTSKYQQVGKESELNQDEECINGLMHRIFTVIDGIDAGGKPLSAVGMENNPELALKLWLMVLDVWGSFYPIEPTEINLTRAKALEKLQEAISELRYCLEEYEYSNNVVVVSICAHAKTLEKCLAKVNVYLKNQVLYRKPSGEFSPGREEMTTLRHHFEYEKAGYLIPLNCGHSGRYSSVELSLLETHLGRIGFIK